MSDFGVDMDGSYQDSAQTKVQHESWQPVRNLLDASNILEIEHDKTFKSIEPEHNPSKKIGAVLAFPNAPESKPTLQSKQENLPQVLIDENSDKAQNARSNVYVPESHDLSAQRKTAQDFFNLVKANQLDAASQLMSETAKQQVTRFDGLWNRIEKDLGQFECITDTKTKSTPTGIEFILESKFERATVPIGVTLDADNKVAHFGLDFFEYKDPPYAQKDKFSEIPIIVGHGKDALSATLDLPNGPGPFPAVVLVHGSGRDDRDETLYSTKGFRDLGWGLASNGIAVLRYDKRNFQYPEEAAPTVNEETVNDAIAAVDTLRQRPDIDSKHITVLGHSLGGYLIPRIAEHCNAASYIVFAGPSRRLEDIIVEQTKHEGGGSRAIEAAKNDAREIKDLSNDPKKMKGPSIFGWLRTWWLDLKNYDPVNESKSLKNPILILQGDHDFQVSVADFQRWKEGLSSKPNVQFKLYPGLSHLFTQAGDPPGVADYMNKRNVSSEVVSDITNWIKHQQ